MFNFLQRIVDFFRPAPYPKDNFIEPAQIIRSKAAVIVYDPIIDAKGAPLSQLMNWRNVPDLLAEFTSDILEISGGQVRYEIAERIDAREFPAKTDGFRDTPQTYLDVWNRVAPQHTPSGVDYYAILRQHNLLTRIARGEIDEVWTFGFPYAGFYESIMGGPGAFWCNAPPLLNTEASKRRFIIMGFSYERGVGEMLEAYGHRAESIMERAFSQTVGEANLWKRFSRYEIAAPGKAACGNIHFAPNSRADYDWGNKAFVQSECYDWRLNFPNFKGDVRAVNADEWGGGDIRAHHKWWFNHMPRVAGRLNGVHNNWWQYIANPNNVIV
ncbi:MAG: hypothetical protein LC099_10045 [Anaerolineales bacterium]|nr:hypothetical protein [Anaerolineales bacterium]